MNQTLAHATRIAALLAPLLLTSCGGGGTKYSISVAPGSLALQGVTGAQAAVERTVTVTFKGDGVIVAYPPGQAQPGWLSVTAPGQSSSPVNVQLSASTMVAPGSYSTTLRFVSGKADGSNVVYTDVPVTYELQEGRQVRVRTRGLAAGSPLTASLNGGAQTNLNPVQHPLLSQLLGTVAVGSSFTVALPNQPPGQHCAFPGGATSYTAVQDATQTELLVTCNAALIAWTWAGGSQTTDDAPVHGTRGVAAPGNTPGGRYGAAHAADDAGDLWLFGGRSSAGAHNDLWHYSVANGQWTWISGSQQADLAGNYGTLNVPAATNVPGARRAAVAWIDAGGNFWLFGGDGISGTGVHEPLNDLWRYDISSGNWTWVAGASNGVLEALGTYGTRNIPSTANIPGFRFEASVATDADGMVWLFGGYGAGAINGFGRMNDLWRFNPGTREWTWMAGSDRPVQTRVHGMLQVPDAANYPAARSGAALWVDPPGNVWVFGGGSPSGLENDLWRYSPATQMWTWMGGTDRTGPVVSSSGTYNAPGAAGNFPAARAYSQAWTDTSGNLWLFGGYATGPDDAASDDGHVNDLWKYSPAGGTWSWLGGSGRPPAPASGAVYGTQGVPALTNAPAARASAASWRDSAGRLWLWGGALHLQDGFVSDLWNVTPQ